MAWGMEVYVLKEGVRSGPFPVFRLQEMLDEGELSAETPVWHAGMGAWRPLGEEESLNTSLRLGPMEAGPPPLPEGYVEAMRVAETVKDVVPMDDRGPEVMVLRARRTLGWRRFFARQIDLLVARAAVTGVLVGLGRVDVWQFVFPGLMVVLTGPAIWVLVEAALLTWLGVTPGKAALGLRVTGADGERLGFVVALKRAVLVWAAGAGFGLPAGFLLPVGQWAMGFHVYLKHGDTLWDRTTHAEVRHRAVNGRGIAAAVVLVSAWVLLTGWVLLRAPGVEQLPAAERDAVERVRSGRP